MNDELLRIIGGLFVENQRLAGRIVQLEQEAASAELRPELEVRPNDPSKP